MIRVLVVDDSPVAAELLTHILKTDGNIAVIGVAADGREAVEAVRRQKPDLVTMDIHMPGINGFEASRSIMETTPVPIVIVTSSCKKEDLETSFRAMEVGALTVLQKPPGIGHPQHDACARNLIATVKLMSEIKVVRRWFRTSGGRSPRRPEAVPAVVTPASATVRLVALGASTGGPPVIGRILAELPRNFFPPVVIVQHMAEGFIQGFADWLAQTSSRPVLVPTHGTMTRPGHVYVAPHGTQMKIDPAGRICCTFDPPENGLRPSVSYLFRSVAVTCGRHAVGVLLTGMGKDGAGELKLMREKGAVTIAQDEESSAVFGMPGEAVRLDAAQYVLPADKIATVLMGIATERVTNHGNIPS